MQILNFISSSYQKQNLNLNLKVLLKMDYQAQSQEQVLKLSTISSYRLFLNRNLQRQRSERSPDSKRTPGSNNEYLSSDHHKPSNMLNFEFVRENGIRSGEQELRVQSSSRENNQYADAQVLGQRLYNHNRLQGSSGDYEPFADNLNHHHYQNISSGQQSRSSLHEQNHYMVNSEGLTYTDQEQIMRNQQRHKVVQEQPKFDRIVQYQRESTSSYGGNIQDQFGGIQSFTALQQVNTPEQDHFAQRNLDFGTQSNQEHFDSHTGKIISGRLDYGIKESQSKPLDSDDKKPQQFVKYDEKFNPVALASALGDPNSQASQDDQLTDTGRGQGHSGSHEERDEFLLPQDLISKQQLESNDGQETQVVSHRQWQNERANCIPSERGQSSRRTPREIGDKLQSQRESDNFTFENDQITGQREALNQLPNSQESLSPQIMSIGPQNVRSENFLKKEKYLPNTQIAQTIDLDQDNGQHLVAANHDINQQLLDPNESLSRPAIISLSSNQKRKTANSYYHVTGNSPSGGPSSQQLHQAQIENDLEFREFAPSNRNHYAEVNGVSHSQTHSLLSGAQQNRQTLLAFSQSNPGSQQASRSIIGDQQNQHGPNDLTDQHCLIQNNSAEMEGLDLTDENIDVTTNGQNCFSEGNETQQNYDVANHKEDTIHLQSKSNHLSSIQKVMDESEEVSQMGTPMINQLNYYQQIGQQIHTQNLDFAEANIQAEVKQLDLIYEQHRFQQMATKNQGYDSQKPNPYLQHQIQNRQNFTNQFVHWPSDQRQAAFLNSLQDDEQNSLTIKQYEEQARAQGLSLSPEQIGQFLQTSTKIDQYERDAVCKSHVSTSLGAPLSPPTLISSDNKKHEQVNQGQIESQTTIGTLQDQVSQLSYYKQICERRILELCPDHPMPLEIKHLGLQIENPQVDSLTKHISGYQEQIGYMAKSHEDKIQAMKQEISDLKVEVERLDQKNQELQQITFQKPDDQYLIQIQEQTQTKKDASVCSGLEASQNQNASVEYSLQLATQIQNMNMAIAQLKSDNESLQKSLNFETLSNEEQRNKIKILKESLQTKMIKEYPPFKAFVAQSKQRCRSNPPQTSKQSSGIAESELSVAQIISGQSGPVNQTFLDNYIQTAIIFQENENLRDKVQQLNHQLAIATKEQNLRNQEVLTILSEGEIQNFQYTTPQLKSKFSLLLQSLNEKQADFTYLQKEMEKLQDTLTILREDNRVLTCDLHEQTAKVAIQEHLNKELDEKQMRIIELQTKVELLSNKLNDYDHLKENMDNEMNINEMRVSQFKEIMRDETSGKIEMSKQMDQIQLRCAQVEHEKRRINDQMLMIKSKSQIDLESIKKQLTASKEYGLEQEAKLREMTQQYQQEALDLRNKHEVESLSQIKQINTLNIKVSELEQKYFAAQFEKTQIDEVLMENTSKNQNLELEILKSKKATEKLRQVQSQLKTANTRLLALETKDEDHFLTVESLKQQKELLEKEREKLSNDLSKAREEADNLQKQHKELSHKQNLLESQGKEKAQQNQFEMDRYKNKEAEQVQKIRALEDQTHMLQKQVEKLEENNQSSEREIEGIQSDLSKQKREKVLLEKQIQDVQEENQQLYRNEERAKRLISQIEELKSHNTVLAKEGSYSDIKNKELQIQIQTLENELRLANRKIVELEEKTQKLTLVSQTQQETHDNILKQCTTQQQDCDTKKSEIMRLVLENKNSLQRIDDLNQKLTKLENIKEDLEGQLSRNISKNNSNCLKFEQDNRILECIKKVQQNTNKALILPFISSLKQQVQVSDILKQSLTGIEQDITDGDESITQEQALDQATNLLLETFNQFTKIDTESETQDVLSNHREIFFEYIKFLQQNIIEKLVSSLIEIRSDNILQQTKQKGLISQLNTFRTQEFQQNQLKEQQENEIHRLEQQVQELDEGDRCLQNQTAGLRQKIKTLELQNQELLQIVEQRDIQINQYTHQVDISQNNKEIVARQLEEMSQLQFNLEIEEAEKKHLWKALKSLKIFLKTDQAFEPLLVMLNEYVILLEQFVFDKKQKKKQIGILTIEDSQNLHEVKQKLKVVEADMKQFKLPVSIQNLIPQQIPHKNQTMQLPPRNRHGSSFTPRVPQEVKQNLTMASSPTKSLTNFRSQSSHIHEDHPNVFRTTAQTQSLGQNIFMATNAETQRIPGFQNYQTQSGFGKTMGQNSARSQRDVNILIGDTTNSLTIKNQAFYNTNSLSSKLDQLMNQ